MNFSGAILEGANFKNAQLSNVTFKNTVLTGVNLADLGVPREALEGCVLSMTREAAEKAGVLAARLDAHQLLITSGAAKGAPACSTARICAPCSTSFAGRPLTGLIARRVTAIGLDFTGSQLQGARFDGADLRECDFSGADLRGASFKDAKLAHAKFEKTNLGSLNLPGGKTRRPTYRRAGDVALITPSWKPASRRGAAA